MGWVVSFAGQKGGAGKTTAATGFAVAVAEEGVSVRLGDMDVQQQSAMSWGLRRKTNGHLPAIDVQIIATEKDIPATRELVDMLVLDLPGAADKRTLAVAKLSDLVVVMTDTNAFELEPTVNFLRALESEGLKAPRVVVALSKVRDTKRADEARTYLDKAGFAALKTPLMDTNAVHDIGNDGRSALEVNNAKLRDEVRAFFDGLMKAFTKATKPLRDAAMEETREQSHSKGRGR
ncbi:MAG: ParA family protein [Proteobacteria bacterium]|nr:ParA family protein [Pseudomonadota bacterium]